MKPIILQRQVKVQCWNVVGVVAKASKRPEMMPVLLRARESTQTSADDIASHLLFESRARRVVAQRLLHLAERYGLMEHTDGKFTLKPAGIEAIDTKQVFVPERGTWTIWTTDDQLIASPILRVEPWNEPTAFDEVQRGRHQERSPRQFVNVPPFLKAAVHRTDAPPGGGGEQLRIDELADKAEAVAADASLELQWNVDERKLRLSGRLRNTRVDVPLTAPPRQASDVWQQLLESVGFWSRWDSKRQALRVGFEETTGRERESLLRDLSITAPSLPSLGTFDAMTVRDVPLQATTKEDAVRWTEWRLQERVRDYATTERFEAWAKEAAAPFAQYAFPVRSRRELAKDAWQRRAEQPSSAWHLNAAEDWSL